MDVIVQPASVAQGLPIRNLSPERRDRRLAVCTNLRRLTCIVVLRNEYIKGDRVLRLKWFRRYFSH